MKSISLKNKIVYFIILLTIVGCKQIKVESSKGLGQYSVGYRSLSLNNINKKGHKIPVDIWYPTNQTKKEKSSYNLLKNSRIKLKLHSTTSSTDVEFINKKSIPLIIFSHGYASVAPSIIKLKENLASHGFLVVAPTHLGTSANDALKGNLKPIEESSLFDRRTDLKSVIELLSYNQSVRGLEWLNDVKISNIGLIGSSYGSTTILTYALVHPGYLPPIDAMIGIVPGAFNTSRERLNQLQIPYIQFVSSLDRVGPLERDADEVYNSMTKSPFYYYYFNRTSHNHFGNMVEAVDAMKSFGLKEWTWNLFNGGKMLKHSYQQCISPNTLEPSKVQNDISMLSNAFLRKYIKNENIDMKKINDQLVTKNDLDIIFREGNKKASYISALKDKTNIESFIGTYEMKLKHNLRCYGTISIESRDQDGYPNILRWHDTTKQSWRLFPAPELNALRVEKTNPYYNICPTYAYSFNPIFEEKNGSLDLRYFKFFGYKFYKISESTDLSKYLAKTP